MNQPPDRIFLQSEREEGRTWERERINETDVAYWREDHVFEKLVEYFQNRPKEIKATNMQDALIEGLENMGCVIELDAKTGE